MVAKKLWHLVSHELPHPLFFRCAIVDITHPLSRLNKILRTGHTRTKLVVLRSSNWASMRTLGAWWSMC